MKIYQIFILIILKPYDLINEHWNDLFEDKTFLNQTNLINTFQLTLIPPNYNQLYEHCAHVTMTMRSLSVFNRSFNFCPTRSIHRVIANDNVSSAILNVNQHSLSIMHRAIIDNVNYMQQIPNRMVWSLYLNCQYLIAISSSSINYLTNVDNEKHNHNNRRQLAKIFYRLFRRKANDVKVNYFRLLISVFLSWNNWKYSALL